MTERTPARQLSSDARRAVLNLIQGFLAARSEITFAYVHGSCVEGWRCAYWDYQPVARRHLAEVLGG